MMDKLGVDKGVILVVIFMTSALLLSSCSSMVCMSGACPSAEDRMMQIQWNPPSLSHQNCPNINGKYKPRISKYGHGYNNPIFHFPSSDKLGFIHVTSNNLEQIPIRNFPNPSKENPNRIGWDDSEFYTSGAYVLIQQSEQELTVSLIGGDGKLYQQRIIILDSSMIGCANGDLIIRTVLLPGPGEGGGWSGSSATEKRFKKLGDGSLQVMTHIREWNYDPLFGLTGMPREERGTVTYAPTQVF